MLKSDWLCQHSGRRNKNPAHVTRRIFPSLPPPPSPRACAPRGKIRMACETRFRLRFRCPWYMVFVHEEKYGWLARLGLGVLGTWCLRLTRPPVDYSLQPHGGSKVLTCNPRNVELCGNNNDCQIKSEASGSRGPTMGAEIYSKAP